MVSPCIAKQTGALVVATAALAQATPPDLYPAWEKGGMIAVLLAIMVALWVSSRADQAKAEKRRTAREDEARKWREDDMRYRTDREDRDQKRHEEMVSALAGLGHKVSENALKCDARCTVIEGMVAHAVTAKKRRKAKNA